MASIIYLIHLRLTLRGLKPRSLVRIQVQRQGRMRASTASTRRCSCASLRARARASQRASEQAGGPACGPWAEAACCRRPSGSRRRGAGNSRSPPPAYPSPPALRPPARHGETALNLHQLPRLANTAALVSRAAPASSSNSRDALAHARQGSYWMSSVCALEKHANDAAGKGAALHAAPLTSCMHLYPRYVIAGQDAPQSRTELRAMRTSSTVKVP